MELEFPTAGKIMNGTTEKVTETIGSVTGTHSPLVFILPFF
jgi:hypothetical protein